MLLVEEPVRDGRIMGQGDPSTSAPTHFGLVSAFGNFFAFFTDEAEAQVAFTEEVLAYDGTDKTWCGLAAFDDRPGGLVWGLDSDDPWVRRSPESHAGV